MTAPAGAALEVADLGVGAGQAGTEEVRSA
jgi:hypothetical protein